ncbi:MAG: 4'-phosphopantetheinyl transferase superfamily protein [Oscillospiraceae bacterium]|jgi:holo-[acyl-carrier protein] synthase|nr:4'-phosphopantetheinyl transferase superfamily protein [Oscillospiraceae bacterium]
MLSVGIDLVEIDRIRRSLQSPRFLTFVYGAEERAELCARGMPPQSLAAAFAAKEAFGKALSTGVAGFYLREVQLLHRDNGAPYLYLCGKALHISEERRLQFTVSVSHTKRYATAVVVAF